MLPAFVPSQAVAQTKAIVPVQTRQEIRTQRSSYTSNLIIVLLQPSQTQVNTDYAITC